MVSDRLEYFALFAPWFHAEFFDDKACGVCEPFCSEVSGVSVFVSVSVGVHHVFGVGIRFRWRVCVVELVVAVQSVTAAGVLILTPLPSGERGIGGWFVLLYAPSCGYCLEASMTVPGTTHPLCGFPPARE